MSSRNHLEQQPTVLLIQGPDMSSALGVHLRSRGVHVETAAVGNMDAVLAALQLDVICVALGRTATKTDPNLVRIFARLKKAEREIPLVALADWPLRAPPTASERVQASVPADLPLAAVAHRIHVLAKRALKGEALDARKHPSTEPAVPAKRPLVSPARPFGSAQPRGTESKLRSEPPRPVKKTLVSRRQPPAKRPTAASSFPEGDPQNRLGSWLEAASQQIESKEAPKTQRVAPDLQPETMRPAPFSSNPTPTARIKSPLPLEDDDAPDSERPSRPHIGTSPSSIRVPLQVAGKPLAGARVALVDRDLTRADALAATLRAHRVQVHLVSTSEDLLHARLLRKFAPHGIIIDERHMADEASSLVQIIRRDPFLQHSQLLVSRYEKLFRSHSGATQLESLLPLLQPLGKAEMSLLEKLGPTCEVEFGFDEVPPHLLLKLLVPRSVSTQLECSRESRKLTWTVGWNAAAEAELSVDGVGRRLTHEEALDWMFTGDETRVVAIQRPETDALRGRALLPLVESRVSAETLERAPAPPEVRIVAGDSGASHSAAPHSSMRPFAMSSKPERRSVSPLAARRALLAPLAVAAAAFLGLVFVQWGRGEEPATLSGAAEAAEIHAAVPEEPAREAKAPAQAPAPQAKSEPKPATDEPEVVEDKGFSVFRMSSQALEKTCEEMLGEWQAPAGNETALAILFFRQAQKRLMAGDNDQAHQLLCQSASLVAGGPGALELGRYYLGRRIYGPAQDVLRLVIENNEGNVEGKLLFADLLHQIGRVEEASQTLVDAIGVELSETSKLKAVSRKYLGDARAALRHVDLPLAERYVRRALALDKESEPALQLLIHLIERRGEPEAAARLKEWLKDEKKKD